MTGVTGWDEVAAGVFQRRYNPLDVSVCVLRGADGLVVVDTRSSHREADEIRADLAVFGRLPIVAVVNTHAHYDHCFGNYRFGPESDLGAPIYGHERMPAHLVEYETPMLAEWVRQGAEPVVITPPTTLVGERGVLDLGDRGIELVHLGRGHTDNDLLVHVPDAGTWLAGDLLEESGPPMYGSGSFPLEWPDTIGALCSRVEDGAILVPGHGAPVDRAFAVAQQAELKQVADLIKEMHTFGVPVDEVLAAGGNRWPYPRDHLASAVVEGYRHLAPRS